MALKQNLSIKLEQRLSPQQIQLMKLLEVPTMELEMRIKQEIEENPALEEGKEEKEDDFESFLRGNRRLGKGCTYGACNRAKENAATRTAATTTVNISATKSESESLGNARGL